MSKISVSAWLCESPLLDHRLLAVLLRFSFSSAMALWQKGLGALHSLFYEHWSHSWEFYPNDLSTFQRPHLLRPSPFGVRISKYKFGGRRKHSDHSTQVGNWKAELKRERGWSIYPYPETLFLVLAAIFAVATFLCGLRSCFEPFLPCLQNLPESCHTVPFLCPSGLGVVEVS